MVSTNVMMAALRALEAAARAAALAGGKLRKRTHPHAKKVTSSEWQSQDDESRGTMRHTARWQALSDLLENFVDETRTCVESVRRVELSGPLLTNALPLFGSQCLPLLDTLNPFLNGAATHGKCHSRSPFSIWTKYAEAFPLVTVRSNEAIVVSLGTTSSFESPNTIM